VDAANRPISTLALQADQEAQEQRDRHLSEQLWLLMAVSLAQELTHAPDAHRRPVRNRPRRARGAAFPCPLNSSSTGARARTEPWRLFTGHFVHLSLLHALLNCVALLLLDRLFADRLRPRELFTILGFTPILVSLVFWLLPELQWYRGLPASCMPSISRAA
jgi:membrane associated rhomboid family serine protease